MSAPPFFQRHTRLGFLWTLHRRIERAEHVKPFRDRLNRWRWGDLAPLSDEPLYVDPGQIHWQINSRAAKRHTCRYLYRDSGRVLDGDWDTHREPVEEAFKYKACAAHFIDGLSWDETGVYDLVNRKIAEIGVFDDCRSHADVGRRYEALDRLYDQVAREGRLKPQSEVASGGRREQGGVFCHIGHDGQFLRFLNGNHRFVIARLLGLAEIPVHVGVVHLKAMQDGVVVAHRSRRKTEL